MTEQYYVAEFAPVQNHTVSTPSKTHLHRSHRKFGVAQAAQADLANDSRIAPRAVVEFMAKQVGGVANLGFIPQDYKNYLHSKRTVRIKVGDAAMVKALAAQWPETVHCLCIWHIYQNAALHLSGVFVRFKDFAKDLSECIYDYEDDDDFIEAWNAMLEKYNLQDNDWLKRMFNIKEKWALVYGRQTFCADMTTTQCSKNMNSVLKKYTSYNNDLLQFFHNFQRLVDNHCYEELEADFRANQSTPSLSFPVQILKHAASIYTQDVFVLVQRELSKAHDCMLEISGENGTITKYEITPYGKHHHHVVTYDSPEDTVMCSCKKFEFGGILCSHALKVLSSNNVVRIPDQYILKRWTKNAKSRSIEATCASSPIEDSKTMMGIRYKELCRLCTQMATRAAETKEAYKIALNALKKISKDVDASLTRQTFHETSHANMSASEETNEATYIW